MAPRHIMSTIESTIPDGYTADQWKRQQALSRAVEHGKIPPIIAGAVAERWRVRGKLPDPFASFRASLSMGRGQRVVR